MSRALGVLLVCAGLVTAIGVTAASPEGIDNSGVYSVALVAILLGATAIVTARRARRWTAHALFASGTALICAGVWFAGAPSGLYAFMLVWVAIVAATFFSPRAVATHILWILVASGVVLAALGPAEGTAPVARWAVGGVLVSIAATVMTRISAGRRATEERLRAEIAERRRLQRELEYLADHDPLTGVANRRGLQQRLARELERARREGGELSVITLDLDGLKQHNDAFGHAAGDRLLQSVAETWAASLSDSDLIARIGGDEFVVLLPACGIERAERLMARLRDEVVGVCGCSAGAACWDGDESADALLSRADVAMYAVKARSRQALEIAAYPAG